MSETKKLEVSNSDAQIDPAEIKIVVDENTDKTESDPSKLNIILSRLPEGTTLQEVEDLIKQNNFNFKNIEMLAC